VHPDKVRRLQRSLYTPKSLTTLNPDELRRVIQAFELKPEEVAHLRAAPLATAVEMLLMDHVDLHIALQEAHETFPILLAAIRQEPPPPGMSEVRDPAPSAAYVIIPGVEYPEPLTQAIDDLDRATLALHSSEGQAPTSERIDRLTQAHAGYVRAVNILESWAESGENSEAWAFWRDRAAGGMTASAQQLVVPQGVSESDR
jgi:hypothetical protein